jgi:type II secretory pathway pseudopilin PulG
MTNRAANSGFTLVEVIVVGVLLMVLALGGYSFFMLYLNESRETVAHLRMDRQAEAFMDEVGREVRRSYRVMRPEDRPPILPENWAAVTGDNAQTLLCYNDAGGFLRGFRFHDNVVQDSTPPPAGPGRWRDFTINGEQITLAPERGASFFRFNAERTQTDVTLTLTNNNFNLRFDGRRFRCRVTELDTELD